MSETLTKLEIIKELSGRHRRYGVTAAATRRVVDGVFELIRRALTSGRRVEIRNFGIFQSVDRAARVARNPRTGERIPVPPRKAIKFTAGREVAMKLAAQNPQPAQ
jgi:nucleoid DNA-binding protein